MDALIIALITWTGVALTALVTWAIAQRRIAAQYITAERAKWREDIRTKALWTHSAILNGDSTAIEQLRIELSALLNPFDPHDKKLLDCLVANNSNESHSTTAGDFADRVRLLLKHDWDRAKLEASVFLFRWFLDVRRWGPDWGNASAVQGSSATRWFKRWARNRRLRKGALWKCETYRVRWFRAALFLATITVVWTCTKLGEFLQKLHSLL